MAIHKSKMATTKITAYALYTLLRYATLLAYLFVSIFRRLASNVDGNVNLRLLLQWRLL